MQATFCLVCDFCWPWRPVPYLAYTGLMLVSFQSWQNITRYTNHKFRARVHISRVQWPQTPNTNTIKISLSSGLKFYMLKKKIFLVVSNLKLIIVFVTIVCSGLKWNFLWYERSYPSKEAYGNTGGWEGTCVCAWTPETAKFQVWPACVTRSVDKQWPFLAALIVWDEKIEFAPKKGFFLFCYSGPKARSSFWLKRRINCRRIFTLF